MWSKMPLATMPTTLVFTAFLLRKDVEQDMLSQECIAFGNHAKLGICSDFASLYNVLCK